MEKTDKIFRHKKFTEAIERINKCEKDRIYCLHGFEHAMDTARIAYIIALEEKIDIDKDIIYSAALLHDLGRYRQYEDGVPHNLAGAQIAKEIMSDCGFDERETEEVLGAVLCHGSEGQTGTLCRILSKADKLSRMCMNCNARESCKWKKEEMNWEIDF